MKLPTITIALIAKNEAHNIDGFFETIALIADELVIALSPSTDDTAAKIEEWKSKVPYSVIVVDYNDPPFHFGKARNETLDRATKDFVFMIDADERLTPGFTSRIKEFLAEKNPLAVSMQRQDDVTPHLIDPQTRIIRNHEGLRYVVGHGGQWHEHIELQQKATWFDEVMIHMQGQQHWNNDHDRFFRMLSREVAREPNTRGLPREILRAMASFFYKFRKEYIRKATYKDGKAGFKYSFMRGFHVFLFHIFVGLKTREKNHVDGNH